MSGNVEQRVSGQRLQDQKTWQVGQDLEGQQGKRDAGTAMTNSDMPGRKGSKPNAMKTLTPKPVPKRKKKYMRVARTKLAEHTISSSSLDSCAPKLKPRDSLEIYREHYNHKQQQTESNEGRVKTRIVADAFEYPESSSFEQQFEERVPLDGHQQGKPEEFLCSSSSDGSFKETGSDGFKVLVSNRRRDNDRKHVRWARNGYSRSCEDLNPKAHVLLNKGSITGMIDSSAKQAAVNKKLQELAELLNAPESSFPTGDLETKDMPHPQCFQCARSAVSPDTATDDMKDITESYSTSCCQSEAGYIEVCNEGCQLCKQEALQGHQAALPESATYVKQEKIHYPASPKCFGRKKPQDFSGYRAQQGCQMPCCAEACSSSDSWCDQKRACGDGRRANQEIYPQPCPFPCCDPFNGKHGIPAGFQGQNSGDHGLGPMLDTGYSRVQNPPGAVHYEDVGQKELVRAVKTDPDAWHLTLTCSGKKGTERKAPGLHCNPYEGYTHGLEKRSKCDMKFQEAYSRGNFGHMEYLNHSAKPSRTHVSSKPHFGHVATMPSCCNNTAFLSSSQRHLVTSAAPKGFNNGQLARFHAGASDDVLVPEMATSTRFSVASEPKSGQGIIAQVDGHREEVMSVKSDGAHSRVTESRDDRNHQRSKTAGPRSSKAARAHKRRQEKSGYACHNLGPGYGNLPHARYALPYYPEPYQGPVMHHSPRFHPHMWQEDRETSITSEVLSSRMTESGDSILSVKRVDAMYRQNRRFIPRPVPVVQGHSSQHKAPGRKHRKSKTDSESRTSSKQRDVKSKESGKTKKSASSPGSSSGKEAHQHRSAKRKGGRRRQSGPAHMPRWSPFDMMQPPTAHPYMSPSQPYFGQCMQYPMNMVPYQSYNCPCAECAPKYMGCICSDCTGQKTRPRKDSDTSKAAVERPKRERKRSFHRRRTSSSSSLASAKSSPCPKTDATSRHDRKVRSRTSTSGGRGPKQNRSSSISTQPSSTARSPRPSPGPEEPASDSGDEASKLVSQTAGTSAADHEAGNVKDDPDERLPEVCCGVEQTAESGEDTAEARDCNADEERQDCRLEPVALDLAREPGGKQEFCSGPDQSPDPTSSNEVDPAQETATVVDEPKEEIQDRLDKSTNTDYAMQISEMYQIPGTRTDVVEAFKEDSEDLPAQGWDDGEGAHMDTASQQESQKSAAATGETRKSATKINEGDSTAFCRDPVRSLPPVFRNMSYLLRYFPKTQKDYNKVASALGVDCLDASECLYSGLISEQQPAPSSNKRPSSVQQQLLPLDNRAAFWSPGRTLEPFEEVEFPGKVPDKSEFDFIGAVTDESVSSKTPVVAKSTQTRTVMRKGDLIVDTRDTEKYFYVTAYCRGSGGKLIKSDVVVDKETRAMRVDSNVKTRHYVKQC